MMTKEELEQRREQKGQEIAKNGSVKRIDEFTYTVKSQSGNSDYTVSKKRNNWICNCADHFYRHALCKHILGVMISLALRTEVAIRRIEPIENLTECIFCGSSDIMKWGIRKNKEYDIQTFICKGCNRKFSFNVGFEKMKHDPKAITMAMQLYFSGESLRNTMRSLELLGVKVSHQTVYNWISKYSKLLQNYAEKLKPNVSGAWRADELWVKVKGDMKYLFALIDDETRYWIAQEVAETKHKHDAKNLFKMAREIAGKRPNLIITDGLDSYHDAWRKEFYTAEYPRTEHINTIKLQGNMNNNKMERFNGSIRDREKVMRGLKTVKTPIFAGHQIYYNFMRGHEALDGKTPAEACGIEVKGDNKWKTLIQNATKG
jgi:transposase-like protein